MTAQNGFDCLFSGMVIPGGQSHRPPLSCLGFVPSIDQILFPGEVGGGVSFTMERLATPFPPPFGEDFGPGGLAFAPWISAILALDLTEFGSGLLFPLESYQNLRGARSFSTPLT